MRFLQAVLLICSFLSQQKAFSQSENSFAIQNLTVHIGNGSVIDNGFIVVEKGKIAAVGASTNFDKNKYPNAIDGQRQHLYPSLIAPNTQLGLVEVEAVRSTRDFAEVGHFNPNIRSLIAYNTDSEILPTVRSNGVLIAQTVPQGGRISGQSSMVKLEAFSWEDAVLAADNGVHLNFPNRFHYTGWWAEPGKTQGHKGYSKDVTAIKMYFDEAVAYAQNPNPNPKNLKFEAMKAVLNKKKKLFVHADEARAMLDAIEVLQPYNVDIVFVGALESYLITDVLKKNNIPVVYMGTHELPSNADMDFDQMYKTPFLLQQAGVRYCLGLGGGSWQMRNLPFIAGNTVAYGVGKEEALKSVTLSAAQILGIDAQVGSLEVGKDATFVISRGDILDMQSSVITDAYINGKKVNLDNKQSRLYEKYKSKYKIK